MTLDSKPMDITFVPLNIHKLSKLLLFNPLNAELNPICHLLALAGARHLVHVSRIRVNPLNTRVGILILATLL